MRTEVIGYGYGFNIRLMGNVFCTFRSVGHIPKGVQLLKYHTYFCKLENIIKASCGIVFYLI